MAAVGHSSNLSLLNAAWESKEAEVAATQSITTKPAAPFRIEVTAPINSEPAEPLTNPPAPPSSSGDEKKSESAPTPSVEPPDLEASAAFDTLRLFHDMGLAGDDDDIFDDIKSLQQSQITPQHDASGTASVAATGSIMPDTLDTAVAEKQFVLRPRSAVHGPRRNEPVPIKGGRVSHKQSAPSHLTNDSFFGGDFFGDPMNAMDGTGKGLRSKTQLVSMAPNLTDDELITPQPRVDGGYDPNQMPMDMEVDPMVAAAAADPDIIVAGNMMVGAQSAQSQRGRPYSATTRRTEHDVKDMADYTEITKTDLDQFEAMLSSTEQLIEDMTTMCNFRGYGLDEIADAEDAINGMVRSENRERDDVDEALNANMAVFGQYAVQQLSRYDFHLSSNAIVDLMGVEPRRSMDQSAARRGSMASDCTLSAQGFVLLEGKRLTPHYFFNVLDEHSRRKVDMVFAKLIRDELRGPRLRMETFEYPSNAELQGITPTLIPQFESQCKTFYKMPAPLMALGRRSMVRGLSEQQRSGILQRTLSHSSLRGRSLLGDAPSDCFCVVVFPNHKEHLRSGIWSRSVSYFDNIGRGTMLSFIESASSEDNGWGVVLMNPNQRRIESQTFQTKMKYDVPNTGRMTESITIPRHESSGAHTVEMWRHFILPKVVKLWKCKLLILSHCDGGHDVVHLLETQPEAHKHIIGIAMLDFYNLSLSEVSKPTRQTIEQKAAIYMSLYGSNESAYGMEPVTASNKSPVTIFRTANKEKRYSPCFNAESVLGFFKSKIELHKQQ